MDMLIIGFVAGFAVAFVVTTLRYGGEADLYHVRLWRALNAQDGYIDELEDERQELRDRLAAELWRNRWLERLTPQAYEVEEDDEASWRVGEIERQIRAWEKL